MSEVPNGLVLFQTNPPMLLYHSSLKAMHRPFLLAGHPVKTKTNPKHIQLAKELRRLQAQEAVGPWTVQPA